MKHILELKLYLITDASPSHRGIPERRMIKAEIDGMLAAEFCKDLLAPVNAAYEDEKARILGKVG